MSAGAEALEITVSSDEDVVAARHKVKLLAQEVGFSTLDITRIVTAVSELARNIVVHARAGRVSFCKLSAAGRHGIKVVFEDKGPGIQNIGAALEGGFSTTGSLGLGLSGARRLVDSFDLKSSPGRGTLVEIIKWL
jgi:serine/threonine-protein kinase RsbT